MLTMAEYIQGMDKDYYKETWENMTAREKLDEYLYNILNLDFSDDFFEVETIEQCISSNKKGLDNPEFEDMKNVILDTIDELEKYKDKGLFCKFVMDKDSCLLGQCYVIFDVNYQFVNYIRVI